MNDKPELKLVQPKFKTQTPLWKPITPKEYAAYQRDLIYAGTTPKSNYNGWRKSDE